MTLPSKTTIRSAFDRAALGYDGAASVQRDICHFLLAGLPPPGATEIILDAGCGTGYGLSLLQQRNPQATLVALDFALGMLYQIPLSPNRMAGDIEELPIQENSLDGWWSSLAVQWCNLTKVISESHRTLRSTGWLALSTLGPRTFHEVRSAFSGLDAYRHTLGFSTPETLSKALATQGFQDISVSTKILTAFYPDLKTLLGAVKAIGANRVGEGQRTGLMGKALWAQVQHRYEAQRTSQGLPLSYEVILCHATK